MPSPFEVVETFLPSIRDPRLNLLITLYDQTSGNHNQSLGVSSDSHHSVPQAENLNSAIGFQRSYPFPPVTARAWA